MRDDMIEMLPVRKPGYHIPGHIPQCFYIVLGKQDPDSTSTSIDPATSEWTELYVAGDLFVGLYG